MEGPESRAGDIEVKLPLPMRPKILSKHDFQIRVTMKEIRLFFGRPVIKEKSGFIRVLKDLAASHGSTLQVLDADKVVSERHLVLAAERALAAFGEGRNVAMDLGVEILRYASAQRQIERAMSMGISDSTERIAIVAVAEASGNGHEVLIEAEICRLIEMDGAGSSYSPEAVREIFDISEEEIRAAGESRIPDLVLERIALMDAYR
jgi:KEOPS complex subunit Cgi121